MQIVIDIPPKEFEHFKQFKGKFICDNGYDLIQAIKNGTPLGNVVSEETYTDEYTRRKDAELELYKLQRNIDDITTEIKEIIKLYEGTCDQELGTKWGFEGALEIIDKYVKEGD